MKHIELKKCDQTFDDNQLEILREVGKIADQIGERCYLVGGAVRDCLLGKENKDLDLVCSDSEALVDALADNMEKDFGKRPTVAKFKKYGTFQIKMQGEEIEFVNPRKETYTYESHKPEFIEVGSFTDDAYRRDFTLNTLFLGIQKDDWMQVSDLTGKGFEDLKAGILRTPLNPDTTFTDDPSRLFRLARFKACKGFEIEEETLLSARRNAHEVDELVMRDGEWKERVPRESVRQMMDKGIICDDYFETLDNLNLLEVVIPEIEAMKDYKQLSKHHLWDVWNHTLKVIKELPKVKELKWAGLFHDSGKPNTFDKYGSFHGHEKESAEIAKKVMTRLKFSNDDIRRISHIIRHHMEPLNLIILDNPRRGQTLSNSAIRRFTVRNDGYESDLIDFAYADTKGSGVHWKSDWKKLEVLEDRISEVQMGLGMSGGQKFQLAISGYDIMDTLQIKPGIRIGEIQRDLKEKVIDGVINNERKELIEYMRGL